MGRRGAAADGGAGGAGAVRRLADLDAKLERELNRLSRQLGRSRSELVRDALRRQLALTKFEQARRALLPLAETQGFLTDEDVFADVS